MPGQRKTQSTKLFKDGSCRQTTLVAFVNREPTSGSDFCHITSGTNSRSLVSNDAQISPATSRSTTPRKTASETGRSRLPRLPDPSGLDGREDLHQQVLSSSSEIKFKLPLQNPTSVSPVDPSESVYCSTIRVYAIRRLGGLLLAQTGGFGGSRVLQPLLENAAAATSTSSDRDETSTKPSHPVAGEANTSIILGTPDAATARGITPGFRPTALTPFLSATGELVAPPTLALKSLPSAPPLPQKRIKARRSAFLVRRHDLAVANQEAAPDPSRHGDYDGLNYAPMHQNPSNSKAVTSTYSSARARKMVQLVSASASALKSTPIPRNPLPQRGHQFRQDDKSFVFDDDDDGAFSQQKTTNKRRKSLVPPPGAYLDTQETEILGDVLKDLDTNDHVPEKRRQVSQASPVKMRLVGKNRRPSKQRANPAPEDDTMLQELLAEEELKGRATTPVVQEHAPGHVVPDSSLPVQEPVVDDLNDSWFNAPIDNWSEDDIPSIPETRLPIHKDIGKQRWYRCRVTAVTRDSKYSTSITANLCDYPEEKDHNFSVQLTGTWMDTPVEMGDIVNLVPSSDCSASGHPSLHAQWVVSDDSPLGAASLLTPALVVLHPEVLVSGTTVASSGVCLRRSVIQSLWAENRASGEASADGQMSLTPGELMLSGSIIHRVFQGVVSKELSGQRSSPIDELSNALHTCSTLLQLYSLNISAPDFCDLLQKQLPLVKRWVDRHCNAKGIGVKGKIDMTVLCKSKESEKLVLVPLELKTGKASFSFDHMGQVLLYLLMLADRYGDGSGGEKYDVSRYGWLVYLREANPSGRGIVPPNATSFRGLVQTRNQLATALKRLTTLPRLVAVDDAPGWNPTLPPPIDSFRICSRCPHALTCRLFRDASTPSPRDPEIQSLLEPSGHVTEGHVRFLQHWTRLQLLEYASGNSVETVLAHIASESTSKRASSGSLRALKRQGVIVKNNGDVFTTLQRRNGEEIDTPGLSLHDFMIVSSDDGRHVGICLATLESFESVSDGGITAASLTIKTESRLPHWIQCFRLDRYVSNKAVQINLSNLVGLMDNTLLGTRLRKLIIDRGEPRFTHSISKSMLLQIRGHLKPLNVHQRKAILSILMSRDYTLVEGFPGSGKTETLAALLRCLAVMNRKTLLISHTHSAVDNVLLRLVQTPEVRFVRLGALEKIHKTLRPYNLESQLSDQLSPPFATAAPCVDLAAETRRLVTFIQDITEQADIVGCTALAAGGGIALGHAALSRSTFDVVVVDEATQLLLPTVLGGLLRLKSEGSQFVLLGDGNQLPPLVQSRTARDAGFSESLFARLLASRPLDGEGTDRGQVDPAESSSASANGCGGGCRVQLRSQYRMNERILRLSNSLFYDGRMECASDAIAMATLSSEKVPRGSPKIESWLSRVVSTELVDSVVFLDTQKLCKSVAFHAGRPNVNAQEVELVLQIIERFTELEGSIYTDRKPLTMKILEKTLTVGVPSKLSVELGICSKEDIGVIAPYRAQVAAIQRFLQRDAATVSRLDSGSGAKAPAIEVNTADQYQGRDKSVIIVSLVDCLCPEHHIPDMDASDAQTKNVTSRSLLNDRARLNVALTRAKHKLILLGCGGGVVEVGGQGGVSSTDHQSRPATSALEEMMAALHAMRAVEVIPAMLSSPTLGVL